MRMRRSDRVLCQASGQRGDTGLHLWSFEGLASGTLREYVFVNETSYVGEAEVASREVVGQLLVIHAHQVE